MPSGSKLLCLARIVLCGVKWDSVASEMSPFTNIRSLMLGAALLALTIPVIAQLPASADPSDAQARQPQTRVQPKLTNVSSRSAVQTFQGTIRRGEDGYILRDSTGASYELDDQIRVRDYEGQNVKLSGTLDAPTCSIQVKSIEPSY